MMTNHVHLIAIPNREDSLGVLFRRVHGRYAQYYNARSGRTGHLWQNRFFACSLGVGHLWTALAYVDRNPVRAGLVASGEDYRWSSAVAHLTEEDEFQLIDMRWWETSSVKKEWPQFLNRHDSDAVAALRASTYAGRPFGDEAFMTEVGARFVDSGIAGVHGRMAFQKFLLRSKRRPNFRYSEIEKNRADQAVPHCSMRRVYLSLPELRAVRLVVS